MSYTKVLKVFTYLSRELKEHGFTLHSEGWQPANLIYFYVDAEPLSQEVVRQGPPATQEKDAEKFKEKNENTFLQNGFCLFKEERPFTVAEDLVQHLLASEFVQSRVAHITLHH